MTLLLKRNRSGRLTVHAINSDTGDALCGRIDAKSCEAVDTAPAKANECRWCASGKPPAWKPEHRMVHVCASCGQPWPCDSVPRDGLCKGVTASGRPCARAAVAGYDDYCRLHWK